MSIRVSSQPLQTVAPTEQAQTAKPSSPMDSAMADLDKAISGLSAQSTGGGGGGSDSFASSLTGARTGAAISSLSGPSGDILDAGDLTALDANIQSQSALGQDSYNGQAAPAGVQPSTSVLASPDTQNNDLFLAAKGGGGGDTAAAPAGPLTDPLLDLKGGGGLSGGVVGSYTFLAGAGGGGLSGGVVGS